jgi:S-layer homology domain/Mannosyl-glycoprotein endo-beta-N-acetylglucosaminidase
MLLSFRTMKTRSLRLPGLLGLALAAVLACTLMQPGIARAEAAGFSDVPASHPYRVQIETLAQLGIIEGYKDGSFHPNAPVTRAQFAKMVILSMRLAATPADECSFVDVRKTSGDALYPDHYVAVVAREGIATGYQGENGPVFKPDASITLAQLVTMGTRAAIRPLFVPSASYRSAWGNFDPSHAVVARVAQYNGLLRELPPPGSTLKAMSPWRTATRAEAAALLFNIMGTDTAGLNGRFLGDSSDLVRYFRAAGKGDGKFSVSLEELAKLYVIWGKRFGIRADMAWAQMIHETGYGQYGGLVQPEQNNMAGIGATGEGVPGNSFASAELGVIAQYAHLAWYIYPAHVSEEACALVLQPPEGPITTPGDPRHFVQPNGAPHKANVRTVYELSGKWAVGPDYGAAIQRIAAGITVSCGLW